jgi:hypothetical protein
MTLIAIKTRRIQTQILIAKIPDDFGEFLPLPAEMLIAELKKAMPSRPEWDGEGFEFVDWQLVDERIFDDGEGPDFEIKLPTTILGRAKEIGVSPVTLRRWRDVEGIDVWDDAAVRDHVLNQRIYNERIAPKFRNRIK